MTDRPILFSGPMVRNILSGAKTETRRVVKLREFCTSTTAGYDFEFRDRRLLWNSVRAELIQKWCPYGVPGDRLWVRETWGDAHPLQVAPGRYSQPGHRGIDGPPPVEYRTVYRADGEVPPTYRLPPDGGHPFRALAPSPGAIQLADKFEWTPSIHMPRWASRLTLAVESVRVERLHDIDDAGARAEGVADREAYQVLWSELNGAESWDANPWVWVVGFKRVSP